MSQFLKSSLSSACQKALGHTPEELHLELCKDPAHGDLASNVAMQLASSLKKNPREIAQAIQGVFQDENVASVEVAGPGFLNFRLTPQALFSIFSTPLPTRPAVNPAGPPVNIEFVSANPTGPLTLGNGRLASVGDTLARCYETLGWQADREFYINDYGNQVNTLTESILAKMRLQKGLPEDFPEEGYRGDYVGELASAFLEHHPQVDPTQTAESPLGQQVEKFAIDTMVAGQKVIMQRFGVDYRTWFSEHSLHESGQVQTTLDDLTQKGATEKRDGALWFLSTRFSDVKDRVLVRENGHPTYLAADVAYHRDKLKRGYARLINIWGADHHGYIERVKSALAALGADPNLLHIYISQMVQLKKEDVIVRMGKRKGNIVTLEHLMDEVPVEVCRWFFLMRSLDSTLDFDMELARDTSEKNPVYYVQYAHARIHSILKKAPAGPHTPDLRFMDEEERLLALKLMEFDVVVERAVARCAVHLVAQYATELAGAFHGYYTRRKVLSGEDDQPTRLAVIERVRERLAMTLYLAGVPAPEQM